jgi:hypothetical protein
VEIKRIRGKALGSDHLKDGKDCGEALNRHTRIAVEICGQRGAVITAGRKMPPTHSGAPVDLRFMFSQRWLQGTGLLDCAFVHGMAGISLVRGVAVGKGETIWARPASDDSSHADSGCSCSRDGLDYCRLFHLGTARPLSKLVSMSSIGSDRDRQGPERQGPVTRSGGQHWHDAGWRVMCCSRFHPRATALLLLSGTGRATPLVFKFPSARFGRWGTRTSGLSL